MRRIIAGTCLVVAGASAVWGYQTWKGAARKEHDANATEAAETRRELQELREQSASLQGAVNELAAAHNRVVALAGQRAAPGDASPGSGQGPARPAAAPPSREEYAAFLDGEYASESPDPRWNPAREVGSKLAAVLPEGSTVRSIECKASMCRLETAHHGAQSYQQFTRIFLKPGDARPWDGPVVFQVTEGAAEGEGDVTAVAYLGRDSLPEYPAAQE
jgi:hypothetical protein